MQINQKASPAAEKIRILVVDDDEDVGEVIVWMLSGDGYMIADYSADGYTINHQAITDYDQYFGIVMDYRLRDRVGPEVISDIRSKGYKGLVVLNTGYPDLRSSPGADAVFFKLDGGRLIHDYFTKKQQELISFQNIKAVAS